MSDGHQLTLVDRNTLSVTGVRHVDSFDEAEVQLKTGMGILLLKGEGLNVNSLNLEEGKLSIIGKISLVQYLEEDQVKRGKSVLKKLLK